MIERQVVCGDRYVAARLPDDTHILPSGLNVPLPATDDLGRAVLDALQRPLDTPPLEEVARGARAVTIAFDDPTVPCYAPVWAVALPLIIESLIRAGVPEGSVRLVCANSLHRRFSHDELSRVIGADLVARFADRLRSHDGEDPDDIVHLGVTPSGLDVTLSRAVTESDLTIYLNCSTTRGFSGGWKSICVGLSSYRSIHHHHTPDVMSMSLDRNRMHEMLDEMGTVVERELGRERIFKLETVLANPLEVHTIFGGTVGACRAAALQTMRASQPARRELLDEPADVVIYGVPDWSPYAAFAHGNPILDLVSTGLGYLGGMIQAAGRPGCTVVLASPCPDRWDDEHHPSYREVWEEVVPVTRDPDEARATYEPLYAARQDLIERYRNGHAFHPVHGIMALYPLKRLRHASRVIVAHPDDESVPAHLGFDTASDIEHGIAMARDEHGSDATVAYVDYPLAFNRS